MNLNKAYDRDSFFPFIKDFLPDFKKDVRKADRKSLKVTEDVAFLGESEDLDLSVFEISHSSSGDARVNLATDGFKLMKNHGVYTALVVYKAKQSQNWRLSLLTTSLSAKKTGGVKKSFSNPRRYSFYLGPDAKVNTPYQFLVKKGQIKDYEDLKSRFSIEVVNKEFYKQISQKFIQLVGGTLGTGKKQTVYEPLLKLPSMTGRNQTALEFGVRLIGRIIFCWFLREKKSDVGKSLMPKKLLSLESVDKNSDYYHKVLEPIFFEVLNRQKESRKEDFSKTPFSDIPYLNGGLFSPHIDDFYKRNNSDFQSQFHNTLIIPDQWFKQLFEILEIYNFTIDENTSFDEELSIDPEMLGRIFENLLAEINPETGESARKSTGSYYTPRVIVEYMIDESLLLYLRQHTGIAENKLRAIISYDLTDDDKYPLTQEEKEKTTSALEKVKLLDPACGSGAFPIGVLQKMVFILQQIDPDGKLWFKRQIKKLPPELRRKMEKEHEYKNFDYIRKLGIIRKNIYGVDIQPIATEISRLRCFLTLVVDQYVKDDENNRNIEPLPNLDFKFVTANTLIGLPDNNQVTLFEDKSGIEQLKDLRNQFFSATNSERYELKDQFKEAQKKMLSRMIAMKAGDDLTQKLSMWNPFSHEASGWFDPEWMFGIKEGFDIIIANPPYGTSVKNEFRKILIEYLGKVPDYEIYYYFIEIARKFLHKQGVMTYITPNTYLFNVYAFNYRKKLLEKWNIRIIIDCSAFKLFASATVRNAITILCKGNNKQTNVGYKETFNAGTFVELSRRKTKYIKKSDLKLVNQNWGLAFKLNKSVLKIITKIKNVPSTIKDFFPEISQGLIAYDKYRGQSREIINNRSFHYTKRVKDSLSEWLWGEDVRPYQVIWNGKEFVDYCSGIANPRDPKFFHGPRVLVREITNPGIYAGYTENEQYHDPSIIVILQGKENILPLLGILNSKLATFYHFNPSPKATKGDFPKILVKDIKDFPVPTWSMTNVLVKEVKNRLNCSDASIEKVELIDRNIDRIIYKKYGLTEKEVGIIERSIK